MYVSSSFPYTLQKITYKHPKVLQLGEALLWIFHYPVKKMGFYKKKFTNISSEVAAAFQ